MIVDKSVNALVKTTAGIASSTGSLVKSAKDMAVNTAVNFSPDFYDQHQDYATGGTKFVAGKTIMTGRNAVRSVNSVRSGIIRVRRLRRKKQIIKKMREIQSNQKEMQKLDRNYEQLKKVINDSKSGIKKDGMTSQYMQSQIRNAKNKTIDLQITRKKLEYKQKKLNRKYSKLDSKKIHPVRSVKSTVSNQTRKAASVVKSKDDFGSKTIGTTMKTMWAKNKYQRTAKSIYHTIVGFAKNLLSGVVAVVTSLPALITTIVGSLPIMIIIIVIAVIISCFASTTYTGRIGTLYVKLDELNQIYEVDLEAAEILAITDVLEWSTQDEECFEQLVSLMLDQKKGNELTFEQMAENVFIKYNPANKYAPDGVYSSEMETGFHYWSLEGLDLNFVINNSVKRNLWYSEHLDLYPLYREADVSLRNEMSTADYQKQLIQEAQDMIQINQERWEDYIYEYNLGDIDLTVTGDAQKGMKVVKKALTKLGCDYIWGAGHSGAEYKDPNLDQFDCSGFVSWAFYQAGIDIGSRTTKELVHMGKEVSLEEIQPGDIIVYYSNATGAGHVVIYIGNKKVVHAPQTGDVVKISGYAPFINTDGAKIRRLY